MRTYKVGKRNAKCYNEWMDWINKQISIKESIDNEINELWDFQEKRVKYTKSEIHLINKVLEELQSFCFNTTNLIDDVSYREAECPADQEVCREYIINLLKKLK